jgi:ABC-2 type transport system ATP-binding protein
MPRQPVIRVDRIRKTYGRVVALDGISFEVEQAEIFGLIGPNGAGKTTTMECVEGLRAPDRGAISVLGIDPLRDASRCANESASSCRKRSSRSGSRCGRRSPCGRRSTARP